MFNFEELVHEDHLVRKINAAIDFEFIRDTVAHLYCPNNGHPAIDSVRMIKMMLLGYPFGYPYRAPSGEGNPSQQCIPLVPCIWG